MVSVYVGPGEKDPGLSRWNRNKCFAHQARLSGSVEERNKTKQIFLKKKVSEEMEGVKEWVVPSDYAPPFAGSRM